MTINKTNIQWTDFTSNPIRFTNRETGAPVTWACVKVSAGCTHCYAETIALRYGKGGPYTVPAMAKIAPRLDEKELHSLLTSKRLAGKRVFLGDMTDLFGEWVPDDMLDRIFAVMALRPDVTWQLLTKRPERMRAYLSDDERELAVLEQAFKTLYENPIVQVASADEWGEQSWPLPNVWMMTSVENQAEADRRIPELLATPTAVRGLSVEPLLGALDLTKWMKGDMSNGATEGERGRGLRRGDRGMDRSEGGRLNLESRAAPQEQVDGSSVSDRDDSASNRRRRGGRLSNGEGDGKRASDVLLSTPTGVEASQRANSVRHDYQPQKWEARRQSTTEPRTGDILGTDVASGSHSEDRESSEPEWREELFEQANRSGSARNQSPTNGGRETNDAGSGFQRGLQGDLQSRTWRPLGSCDLVIVGGESGPHAREFREDWAADIRDQCAAASVPFFFKQYGSNAWRDTGEHGLVKLRFNNSHGSNIDEFADDLRIRQFPEVQR